MGRKAKTPDIQRKLDDRFLTLPSCAKNAIRNSRLGHFGDEIFPLIDPDDFMVLYSDNGRGPSYIQGYVGLYLLYLMLHETADDLMLRVQTDVSIQYALHTTFLFIFESNSRASSLSSSDNSSLFLYYLLGHWYRVFRPFCEQTVRALNKVNLCVPN